MHITTITLIGRRVYIRSEFLIRKGVTLGGNLNKRRDGTTPPILGNNILIGAGVKILGPAKRGNKCILGANVVVTHPMCQDTFRFKKEVTIQLKLFASCKKAAEMSVGDIKPDKTALSGLYCFNRINLYPWRYKLFQILWRASWRKNSVF